MLSIVDLLSSYVIAAPLKSASAEDTCQALYNHVFCQDNHNDNGPAFVSKIYTQISEKFCIKLSFASCFHPRSTAKVEHQNQNILNLLKCLTKDHTVAKVFIDSF